MLLRESKILNGPEQNCDSLYYVAVIFPKNITNSSEQQNLEGQLKLFADKLVIINVMV